MNRVCVGQQGLDLSKEVLWVSVCQRAAELPAGKFRGLKKKFCHSSRFDNRLEIPPGVVEHYELPWGHKKFFKLDESHTKWKFGTSEEIIAAFFTKNTSTGVNISQKELRWPKGIV